MEISCKNTKAVFYHLKTYTDVPIDTLLEGLPVTLEYLENPKNRIDWDVYAEIFDRLTEYYPTHQDQERLGLDIVRVPNKEPQIRKLLGLAIDVRHVYKLGWLWVARKEWPHCRFTYEELDDGRLRVGWEMDQGERISKPILTITAGILRGYPMFIGLPEAKVEAELSSYSAIYIITPPPSLTLFARLKRVFQVFTTSKTAIDELAAQQQEIVESEARFRAIAETAVDAVVSINNDGEIVFWNRAAENIFGYSTAEVLHRPYTMIVPERFRAASEEAIRGTTSIGEGLFSGTPVEHYGLRKDGSEIPVETSVASWKTSQGVFYTAIIRDISRRKQAEEKIRQSEERYRSLAQQLLTVQDEERTRLSRDLHDSLGQQLATLALYNGLVKKKVRSQLPELVGDFNEISRLLNEAIEECHRLAFELTPPFFSKVRISIGRQRGG